MAFKDVIVDIETEKAQQRANENNRRDDSKVTAMTSDGPVFLSQDNKTHHHSDDKQADKPTSLQQESLNKLCSFSVIGFAKSTKICGEKVLWNTSQTIKLTLNSVRPMA
ncbi:MAG: hypothetical protein PUF32_03985 [Prevotella sp.]|nr:hypothetical protein [Prevotella sp.]